MASDKTLVAMVKAGERIANLPMSSNDNPWEEHVNQRYRMTSTLRIPYSPRLRRLRKYGGKD